MPNLNFGESKQIDPGGSDHRYANPYSVTSQGQLQGERYGAPSVKNGTVVLQGTCLIRHCGSSLLLERDVLLESRNFRFIDILADFPAELLDI